MKALVRSALLAFSVCVAVSGASAAEFRQAQAAPASGWSGIYAGLNAGYGSSELAQIPDQGLGNISGSGWLVGAQIGYNYQFQRIVLGLEADLNFSGMRGSRTADLCVGCGIPNTVTPTLNWFGTIRPRLGYDVGYGFLPYVTAGMAYGSLTVKDRMDFGGGFTSTTTVKQSAVGYAWGAGLEFPVAYNWTARVEYLRLEFDVNKTNGDFFSQEVRSSHNIGRFAVNYRF